MQANEPQSQPIQYNWIPQKCPLCLNSPDEFLGMRGGPYHRQGFGQPAEIWRCGRCGLIFPNPMPIPNANDTGHYDMPVGEYFHHHNEAQKEREQRRRLLQAEALVHGRGRLLDIGAGRGELLRVASQKGWDAIGIEPSPGFAQYARRCPQVEVMQAKLHQCNFTSASFDVVILAAVLEHLYDPIEVVREISRILKPGGVLFVDVPNEAGLYFRVGNLYQRLRGRNWVVHLSPTFSPFHVFGFTPKSLRLLLAKHGLSSVVWRVYGGTSWVPAGLGLMGTIERTAAAIVTKLSGLGELGTYIETWARKDL